MIGLDFAFVHPTAIFVVVGSWSLGTTRHSDRLCITRHSDRLATTVIDTRNQLAVLQ
jgi:hypothetical protein